MRLRAATSTRARRAGVALTSVVLAVAAIAAVGPADADPDSIDDFARADAIAERSRPAVTPGALPASRFVPITPTRVLDTRAGGSPRRGQSRLSSSMALSIDPIEGTNVATQLAGLGIDPADATAVVVNVTAFDSGSAGVSTTWPTGFERPGVSTNRPSFAGDIASGLTIVPLGLDGKVSIHTTAESDYLVDVMGVMIESGSSAAGRFVSLGPTRHSDTRQPSQHVGAGQTRHPGGRVRTIDVRVAGVPTNASAVILNVTALNAAAVGHITVSPGGTGAALSDEVASLYVAPGEVRGNQVIVGLDSGRIDLYTDVATDAILDVTGYFTGAGSPTSSTGLFVPISAGRLLDTREPGGPTGLTGGNPVAGQTSLSVPVAGGLDGLIPTVGAQAAVFTITAVAPASAGFIAGYAADRSLPITSSVNFTQPGGIAMNQAITALGAGGIRLFASTTTHVVLDSTGYFLSSAGAPPAALRPNKFIPADHPGTSVARLSSSARPPSGPYDFLFDRGEAPINPPIRVAWDACRPIRYALNIDRADDDQIATMIDSIKHVELSTGIDFQFAGVTSAGLNIDTNIVLAETRGLPFRYLPPDDDGSGPVDVVIGFSDGGDTVEFERSGVIGIGGSSRGPLDSTRRALSGQGFALVDLEDLETGNPTRELIRIGATATHELGHMVGLAHVDDADPGLAGPFNSAVIRDQLMFPFLNEFRPSPTEFSNGDLLGLWELYNTAEFPCNTLRLAGTPDGPWVDVRTSLDDR